MTNGNDSVHTTNNRECVSVNKHGDRNYDFIKKGGLSKREYFSAMALMGFCADNRVPLADIASSSVRKADELINALNEITPPMSDEEKEELLKLIKDKQ